MSNGNCFVHPRNLGSHFLFSYFDLFFLKTFKAHCLDFAALASYIKDLMAFQETHSARILELATENATLKSELVAARSSNEDLTKSIDILSRQYLS